MLSGNFLLIALLTAMISNQATASILASLAIEAAKAMGVEARMLFMIVTFAASLSLITLWGHQTNTLIYGPARYRFTDFTKGAPLNLLFWILVTLFIPIFMPFQSVSIPNWFVTSLQKIVWVNWSIHSRFLQNQLHPLFF